MHQSKAFCSVLVVLADFQQALEILFPYKSGLRFASNLVRWRQYVDSESAENTSAWQQMSAYRQAVSQWPGTR